MSRIYKSPPLVEALCEFQFSSESWDWTIPGLIYQEIKDEFPQKRQLNRVEFKIGTFERPENQPLSSNADRIHFLNNDNTELVQVGPDLLVINHLQPYPHWQDFRPHISKMFDVYRRIAKPTKIKRIGLRYINKIQIPEASFHISNYFNLEPRLPGEVPHQFKSMFMRVEIPYLSDTGLLVLTFGSVESDQPEKTSFILDFDFSTLPNTTIQAQDSEIWIESAHKNIESTFEACISDNLRALFQEEKL